MTSRPRRIPAICLLILLAHGCGILLATVTPAAPQPQTTSASGQSAILFRVVPPPGTPSDASLSLIVMDPVTGLAYNSQDNPMQAMVAEKAGLDLVLMGGYDVSLSLLGFPDVGLMTETEMVTNARNIATY